MAVSARESLRFAQVTGYEAVFVDQNTVLQRTRRSSPKERKLADVKQRILPRLPAFSNAQAEPKFGYATARYGAP
jgi:hypothetical protein